MPHRQVTVDQAIQASGWTTYTGGFGAVMFGLDAQEVGIYGGLLIGVIGLVVNIYFKTLQRKDLQAHYKAHYK